MNASDVSARPSTWDSERALDLARSTLTIEVQALQAMSARLDQDFAQVVQKILQLPGRVVVMGMGKSGHVGRKLAATLASTGTPSFFVHPAEASHGDLGMVTGDDLVLALSNSGESDEITSLLTALKRQGVEEVAQHLWDWAHPKEKPVKTPRPAPDAAPGDESEPDTEASAPPAPEQS